MNPFTWLLSKLTGRNLTRQRTKLVTFEGDEKSKRVTSITEKIGNGRQRKVASKPSKEEKKLANQFFRPLAGGKVVKPTPPKEIRKIVKAAIRQANSKAKK